MGKTYMESVILEEVRKLSNVLGFQSNRSNNTHKVELCKSWSQIRHDNPFNISTEIIYDKEKSYGMKD